jgi:hypothetical protein
MEISDSTVRRSGPPPDGTAGYGLSLFGPGAFTGAGLVIEDTAGLGVGIANGADVVLTDSTVRGTVPGGDKGTVAGIAVGGGSALAADGLLLERNYNAGVFAQDPGTEVTLRNTSITGTLHIATEPSASGGVLVGSGARLEAQGLEVTDTEGVGVLADGGGAAPIRAAAASPGRSARGSTTSSVQERWGRSSSGALARSAGQNPVLGSHRTAPERTPPTRASGAPTTRSRQPSPSTSTAAIARPSCSFS